MNLEESELERVSIYIATAKQKVNDLIRGVNEPTLELTHIKDGLDIAMIILNDLRNKIKEVKNMNDKLKKEIKDICCEALRTDGDSHKQWYIERILEAMDYDLKELSVMLCIKEAKEKSRNPIEYYNEFNNEGYWWEVGIAP